MAVLNPLTAISPIDGRYHRQTEALSIYFSEFGLIRYRLLVEVEYFIALCKIPLPGLEKIKPGTFKALRALYQSFDTKGAEEVKEIEKETNHDVKAIEYYLKRRFDEMGLSPQKEFIHLGLTSQDINNTAVPLSIKECMPLVMENFSMVLNFLDKLALEWKDVPMLARTHGQPASPTGLGKEISVFSTRLRVQLAQLSIIPISAKFGGATGNFNAHHVAYPGIDWNAFALEFVEKTLGLKRSYPTTQIEHYDNLAALFDNLKRINTILLDLCKDIWHYISINYFKQKIKANEVGSSAMPHKVNPIDFENAEGNLGVANALLEHLSAKLPVSRLQRDLTDSTVLRNIGMPVGYMLIALKSIVKGLNKIELNKMVIDHDLEDNWAVVAEAIQTVLRREGYPNPYEALKALTRKNEKIGKAAITEFVDNLVIPEKVKEELKRITPFNYTGLMPPLE